MRAILVALLFSLVGLGCAKQLQTIDDPAYISFDQALRKGENLQSISMRAYPDQEDLILEFLVHGSWKWCRTGEIKTRSGSFPLFNEKEWIRTSDYALILPKRVSRKSTAQYPVEEWSTVYLCHTHLPLSEKHVQEIRKALAVPCSD